MPDTTFDSAVSPATSPQSTGPKPDQTGNSSAPPASMDDASLLKFFERAKKEAFDQRWIFERQWLRNIYYVLGRQWIFYNTKRGEWQDKRLAKWIPRPVTNKCKETVQAIRAMFASIDIGVNIRPNGNDPKAVTTAGIADELAPLLHEEHRMDAVLNEADYWFIVTGNVFIHSYWDYDPKYGVTNISMEQCQGCGEEYSSDQIAKSGQVCPDCGSSQFTPAIDPATGQPVIKPMPEGKGVTTVLSPLEVAFPLSYARFEDLPFIIRMRWRHKSYFESNPALQPLVAKIQFQKMPSERSLQIFKSLPLQNDLGTMPFAWSAGPTTTEEEGIVEYELWHKPTSDYPDGLVLRVVGDASPIVLHLEEDESVPGPIPYTDAAGNPMFTFSHAGYDHVGGRILASGAIDPIIQKQDQLNQLDSLTQMIIQRMANPIWLEPKGAEVEKFTGEPGLVVKWNPLISGGMAKPERIPGEGPHASFFTLRQQYTQDIEELSGTFDVLKGQKPTGVEAFSALQLLVERSQARFTSAFQARGALYRDWFSFAIELERQFGPDERTLQVMAPNRSYAFKTFKNAQLQGSIIVSVEDGTMTPKTALGHRASIEHLFQLGLINPGSPDQQYAIYESFGETSLNPSLDVHVQAALRKQQAFEEWLVNPAAQAQSMQVAQQKVQEYQQQLVAAQPDPVTGAPNLPPPPSPASVTPLAWKPWYDAPIHLQEFLKWINSDRMIELMAQHPNAEPILASALQEIKANMPPPPMPAGAPPQGAQPRVPRQGSGTSMGNSNANSKPPGAQDAHKPGAA